VLVEDWKTLGSKLPEGWSSAQVELTLETPDEAVQAARLLGPAQPYRVEQKVLRFTVARDGSAPSPDGIQRLLRRIDALYIHGKLEVARSTTADRGAQPEPTTLPGSWEVELAKLPPDWSDLLAEIVLESTDYVEPAALWCAPLNPRRDGSRAALRFRAASRFGYGASPTITRRCLERCEEQGIRGSVTILQALSDTKPVATQGPVWLMSGSTV
jgi:hypothetical protein